MAAMLLKALAVLLAICPLACALQQQVSSFAGVDVVTGLVADSVTPGADVYSLTGRTQQIGSSSESGSARRLRQANPSLCTYCSQIPTLPVCGSDGKTYDNSCYALCAGAIVTGIGKCRQSSGGCACPGVWAPVCGGGKTHLNPCAAKCAGVSAATPGVCTPDCKCPSTKATVCGLDGKTYDNLCKATCAGTLAYYSGPCDTRIGTCKCATVYDPVCVTNRVVVKNPGAGDLTFSVNITFGSPCLARCQANVTKWSKGPCSDQAKPEEFEKFTCGCRFTLQPVCAQGAYNYTSTQLSPCVANCTNSKVLYPGLCRNECICLTPSDPVCANGKTYPSACQARCAKASTWKKGACTPCAKCPVPTAASRVCGKDNKTYGNQCLAQCVGVQVARKGAC